MTPMPSVPTSEPARRPAELAAVGVHSVAMFAAMAAVAVVVLERVGLAILRRAWLNLDRVRTTALLGAGTLTLALGPARPHPSIDG